MTDGRIPIWFFIGLILLIYGVLILGTGIYNYYYPPEHPVVLSHLHAGIWWGALLALIGGFYCRRFAPRKGDSPSATGSELTKEKEAGITNR